jgi:anti-sigma-K factor RskA
VLPWLAATAAAALVAVGVVTIFDDDGTPTEPMVAAAEAAAADRDSRSAELVAEGSDVVVEAVVDNDGHGFLFGDALPELGDDQTYQLWGVVGEQVISLGIIGPHPELETFTVRGDLVALAVTIEQAGGVISNGNPVGAFVGELA